MALITFARDTPVSEVLPALAKDGCFIVRDFLTPEQLSGLNAEIQPQLAKISPGSKRAPEDQYLNQDFHGARTKRLTRLLSFSPTLPEILEHPFIRGMLEATLLRYCNGVWLNTAQVIDIGPGETRQTLHRDGITYGRLFVESGRDGPEMMVTFMLALSDFTAENGATRVIPGSHRWSDVTDYGDFEQTVPAEMSAGSMLFCPTRTVHAGGANMTDAPRCGLGVAFNLSHLVPEEAHPFLVPEEIARKLSPRVQQMIGYRSFLDKEYAGVWEADFEDLADYLKLD